MPQCILLLLSLVSLVQDISCSQGLVIKPVSAGEFISKCLDFNLPPAGNSSRLIRCRSLSCHNERRQFLHLGQMEALRCEEDADCRSGRTDMICSKVSARSSYCDCPQGTAFNVTTCSCEKADICDEEEKDCSTYKAMKCQGQSCSCIRNGSSNFIDLLFDPRSRFCVLPYLQASPGHSPAALIVICIVGGILSLLVVVIGGLVVYRNCTCDQGDYECEVSDEVDEVHIAAWDHPSLDYIPKDQDIVFTLRQASENIGQSNASTIHVVDHHENIAYVDDDDDPRHD